MLLENIIYYVNIFFMFYIFIYSVIFFFSTFLSIIDLEKFFKRRKFMNNMTISNKLNYIPISILVPAYNEDVTIIDSIGSLLNLDYPEYEIVIINDGSTDLTPDKIIKEFKLKKIKRPIRKLVRCNDEISIFERKIGKTSVTLINKVNGGKADALNMGINASRYPLFVSLDADSILQEDSLSKIVEPFLENDNTVAVGGNIKISNYLIMEKGKIIGKTTPKKLIVLFQMVEYFRSFLSTKVSFNKLNTNLIISGAFGLFRKQPVVQAGGYKVDTVGEDMEMVMNLHAYCIKSKREYDISYVPDAVCWTQVPEKYKDLKKQRRRWHMGLMQSLWRHKYIFLNPRYGSVGFLGYIYYLFFEFLSPIVEILGLIVIPTAYFLNLLNFEFMLTYLSIFVGYSFIISVASITFESYLFRKSISTKMVFLLFGVSFLECFGYRQLCSLYRLSSFVGYKKNKLSWGKITRRQNKKEEKESLRAS